MEFEKVSLVSVVEVPEQPEPLPPPSVGQHTRHVPSLQYLPPTPEQVCPGDNPIMEHSAQALPHSKHAPTIKNLIFMKSPFVFT